MTNRKTYRFDAQQVGLCEGAIPITTYPRDDERRK